MMKITRKTHNIATASRHRIAFIVISMLVVLIGGLLTLFWQEQHRPISHAADDSIVGPPSLPAATVDAIFTRLGSPMVGTGQVVETASRNANIDDAFALAVWWAETNDGMAGVGLGYHNPGGVQASPNYPRNGYSIYPSYAAAVTDWFDIVQSRYVNRGLTSVYTICYPYVGTTGALNWANKVMTYMTSYRASAPPPPPTPTPLIVPTAAPAAAAVVKPKQNASPLKKVDQRPVASPKVNVTGPQLLLTGIGLIVAVLLAVPGVLINRKRRAGGSMGISLPNLLFEPEEAINSLSAITTLHMEAISAQQLNPLYTNQYSPLLEGEAVSASNTSQLEYDVLPTIPALPSFTGPLLEPVANGRVGVPPTPLQRVPATPQFRGIPATPLLPHPQSSSGGLLARYNVQSRPRRIALRPTSGTTMPHKIASYYNEGGAEMQSGSQTETRYQQYRSEGTEQ